MSAIVLIWNKTDYSDIEIVRDSYDKLKPAIFDGRVDAEDFAIGHFVNYRIISLYGKDSI